MTAATVEQIRPVMIMDLIMGMERLETTAVIKVQKILAIRMVYMEELGLSGMVHATLATAVHCLEDRARIMAGAVMVQLETQLVMLQVPVMTIQGSLTVNVAIMWVHATIILVKLCVVPVYAILQMKKNKHVIHIRYLPYYFCLKHAIYYNINFLNTCGENQKKVIK